jgi:hypothetical protein
MSELFNVVVHDDPLTAGLLGLVFLLVAPLTVSHILRIFGGFFVDLMREYRHEFVGLGKVVDDVRAEIRKWKDDPRSGRRRHRAELPDSRD